MRVLLKRYQVLPLLFVAIWMPKQQSYPPMSVMKHFNDASSMTQITFIFPCFTLKEMWKYVCKLSTSRPLIWMTPSCQPYMYMIRTPKIVLCLTIPNLNSSPPSASCISMDWVDIGLSNGLSPVRSQAITGTSADVLSIGLMGTKLSDIWIETLSFSLKKMHMKMSSAKLAAILSRLRLGTKANTLCIIVHILQT